MSKILYYESLETAVITYSATADTNYPETNLQDRNLSTFYQDTNIGATSVNFIFDLGEARTCDYIIIANYLATSTDDIVWAKLESADDAAFTVNNTTHFTDQPITASDLTNYIKTWVAGTARRYWRLTIQDDAGDNLDDVQIASIFLGSDLTMEHESEIGDRDSRPAASVVNESDGGNRYGRKRRRTARIKKGWNFKYLSATAKSNLETMELEIGVDEEGGLSALPLFWSEDSGATLNLARVKGEIAFTEIADDFWNASIALEGEV